MLINIGPFCSFYSPKETTEIGEAEYEEDTETV
jgi:hypothetical protein